MNINSQKKYFISFLIAIISFFLFTNNVSAIILSPTKQTLVIKPGKSELIKFEVVNDSEMTKIVIPEVEAFKIDDKTGRPIFGQRDEAISWISPTKNEITLKPGAKGAFSFTVSAPNDADPLGHYIALFAKEKNTGGQIGLSSRVGSLLFLYPEGKINESLYLVSFNSEKNTYDHGSVKLFLTLKNNGNIHLVPEGEVTIRNHAKKIIAKININDLNRKVLPNGTWSAEYLLPLKFDRSDIGIIYAEADIIYGLTKQRMGVTASFWYLPTKMLLVYFSVFCVFSLLIFFITKKYLKK